jgi:hypothetical protein
MRRACGIRLQPVLAILRDEIARGAGRDPEVIQSMYERFVRDNPRPAGGWDHLPTLEHS